MPVAVAGRSNKQVCQRKTGERNKTKQNRRCRYSKGTMGRVAIGVARGSENIWRRVRKKKVVSRERGGRRLSGKSGSFECRGLTTWGGRRDDNVIDKKNGEW